VEFIPNSLSDAIPLYENMSYSAKIVGYLVDK